MVRHCQHGTERMALQGESTMQQSELVLVLQVALVAILPLHGGVKVALNQAPVGHIA